MNRNTLHSFELAPHETMKRSVFDLSHSVKTSFNFADVIPTLLLEVLPGDTISLKTSSVVRLQTMIDPIFDDMYLDYYYFFVPNRLVWEHWKNFMGENDQGSWTNNQIKYTIPQITSPASTGWDVGTIADYLGIPTGVPGISVNALPFRAYALICDQFFRNQNTTDPVDYTVDDTTVSGVNTGDQVTDIVLGGLPFKAAKYPDYFTTALPSPQKAADTLLPLGNLAPVITSGTNNDFSKYPKDSSNNAYPISFGKTDDSAFTSTTNGSYNITMTNGQKAAPSFASDSYPGNVVSSVYPTNLVTDLTNATGSSVNQLRLAFQIQKMAELDARSGTRYIEKIKAHFGVISPDARMQRAEYLGGKIRQRLNVNSVSQTSATGATGTPQGHQAAYSVSAMSHGDFSKSFTEHGYIIGLAVARYHHTYQQGLARTWSRKDINSYFWPMLSNIGELPIYTKELFCTGNSAIDDSVFGYNEAWADYRYMPNRTTGEMRSQATTSLDSWHLGDDYSSAPSLSSSWIQEDKSNVDRCLAVSSALANQLFGDFYFDIKATRVMPTYSVPGLIDHH